MPAVLAASLSLLATALAITAGTALAADTLDQQQTDASVNGYVVGPMSGPTSSAETFTAGLSGALDRVDLFLDCFVCSNTMGVTVQITDAAAGAPGTTVLATANIPAVSVGAAPAFIPVAFSGPATVQAGTQYAIVAYTGGSDTYHWYAAPGTPYSGGQGFTSGASPPGSWSPASKTFAFKTYVNPPAPQPSGSTAGPTGQRAAALKKCKHKHSKKKRRKCKRRANLLPV